MARICCCPCPLYSMRTNIADYNEAELAQLLMWLASVACCGRTSKSLMKWFLLSDSAAEESESKMRYKLRLLDGGREAKLNQETPVCGHPDDGVCDLADSASCGSVFRRVCGQVCIVRFYTKTVGRHQVTLKVQF